MAKFIPLTEEAEMKIQQKAAQVRKKFSAPGKSKRFRASRQTHWIGDDKPTPRGIQVLTGPRRGEWL